MKGKIWYGISSVETAAVKLSLLVFEEVKWLAMFGNPLPFGNVAPYCTYFRSARLEVMG